jgi:signal transduction histidine kinase
MSSTLTALVPSLRLKKPTHRSGFLRLARLLREGEDLLARLLHDWVTKLAWRGIVTSITDRSSSEMEIGLRLLRRLCHDIRQELAVIQALVELATTDPDLPEQSRRRLDQISAHTAYVTDMMRKAVERTASLTELDVAKFITGVVADVQLRSETRCHLQAAPCRVLADPVLLRRAVLNMLDNAVRAAGPTGSVDVRVSVDGEDVLIDVEDSGPGFGHGNPGLASLGLAVVHDCAWAHGGQIDTGNGESGGAFVRLRLPQAPTWQLAGLRDA